MTTLYTVIWEQNGERRAAHTTSATAADTLLELLAHRAFAVGDVARPRVTGAQLDELFPPR